MLSVLSNNAHTNLHKFFHFHRNVNKLAKAQNEQSQM